MWSLFTLRSRLFHRRVIRQSNCSFICSAEIFDKLQKLTQGKTVIIVSHRLSTARFADHIIFLEKGRVAEAGTHQELMKNQAQYAEIYMRFYCINDSIYIIQQWVWCWSHDRGQENWWQADRDRFNERKDTVQKIANNLKAKYGENSVTVDMNDQYYNMREKIEPVTSMLL